MTCCIPEIEPCHSGDCDGFNEVVKLLPHGEMWNPDRGGVYGGYINAIGHIKTEYNKRICQEQNEFDPCKADRLFPYWANLYKLPPCVEQTSENLCKWIDLIYGDCPIGSQGFLRRAIEFVMGSDFTIEFNLPDGFASPWRSDSLCADENTIIISAPLDKFKYYEVDGDYPHDSQDGVNPCRRYFIPDIECLRPCIFLIGLSVGYKTLDEGENNINNWEAIEKTERPKTSLICNSKTGKYNDRIC